MFSIDVGFEDDLNKCFISEHLKDIFKTGGVSLSGNDKVTKEKKEEINGWIIDGKEIQCQERRRYAKHIQKIIR